MTTIVEVWEHEVWSWRGWVAPDFPAIRTADGVAAASTLAT